MIAATLSENNFIGSTLENTNRAFYPPIEFGIGKESNERKAVFKTWKYRTTKVKKKVL
jgi:hypothetical protein